MRIIKKILKITAIALLILIGVPLIIGQILRLTAAVESPPGEMVDVGGYKLHIKCAGPVNNSEPELPTVVFEAGAGVSSPTNYWIQEGVSKTARICVYDRAGLGWSEESGLPRDSKTINTALHTLLDKAGVKRPFVFAGHSIAGLYMRDYVERFPGEVAGIAFLDPSHPDQNEKFGFTGSQKAEQMSRINTIIFVAKLLMKTGVMEVYNPTIAGDVTSYPENIQKQIAYLSKKPANLDTALREANDFEIAGAQAALNKSLGDLPVVVISATMPMDPSSLPKGVSAEKFQSTFVSLHDEIAALSTKGTHIKMETANHMSLITNSENAKNVVPYIINIVNEAADRGRDPDSEETTAKR
ncbi:MAG: alpha/beta hydrolase [Acidobacteria bacterium]|nr:alpha/beta hydrolase [Acidobacteriota bacterium]